MKNPVRLADFLIDYLIRKKSDHFFLVPGGGAMFLNDAIVTNQKAKFVPCHNEQAVSISAEAYSRVNSGFGVAIVTSGPGSTNAITGFAGSWIESVPVLIISGQVKRDDLKGVGVRQNGPQEVDIIEIIKPISKYAVRLMDPTKILYVLEKAIFNLNNGRKGPCWIDIPLDVQSAMINPSKLKTYNPPPIHSSKKIQSLNKLIDSLKVSKRPLLLIGHGVRLSGAEKHFIKLIQKLKIPFVTTWNALDLIPYDSPYNIGRPGVVALRAPNFAIQNCDLLVSIGARLDNIVTAFNLNNFAIHAKKFVVDIDKFELKKFGRSFIKINSDALIFIQQLTKYSETNPSKKFQEWVNKCNYWKEMYSLQNELPVSNSKSISHLYLINELSNFIPNNSLIVTGSSGLAVESFYLGFKNKYNQRVFLTSGLGSMGYGVPAFIGAAINSKFDNIFCIESDGSFMMNIQEIATLKNIKKKFKIILLNNKGYASIRNTQNNYFNGRSIATSEKSGLFIPNLSKVINSFGYKTIDIFKKNELKKKLRRFIESNESTFCNIHLIENEVLQPKCSAIQLKDGSFKSMPLEDMYPYLSRKTLREEMYYPLSKISEELDEKNFL